MTLIKTSLLTAISTVVTVIAGLIINKFIAIYIGPSGLATIGNFQNFIQIIKTIGSGSTQTAIVKYTAEYKHNNLKLVKLLSSAFYILCVIYLVVFIFTLLLGESLALWIFGDVEFVSILYIFSAASGLFFLNQFFLSIFNGLKEIKTYVLLNIFTSIISLIIIVILIYYMKLYGALLALAINQSLVFFVTLFFVWKSKSIQLYMLLNGYDKKSFKRLSGFISMALASGISVPLTQMILRDYIGDSISWEAAGYWEAMWRISAVYLLLVTTSLSVYYIPKLSELNSQKELRNEILYGYKVIMPIVIIAAISIYISQDLIISLLFTDDFMPMKTLFFYMLLGDVIKVAAWLLSNIMLAKAMIRTFILTELLFKVPFLFFTISLSNMYGLEGVAMGYFINYILYFLVMLYIFKDLLLNARMKFR